MRELKRLKEGTFDKINIEGDINDYIDDVIDTYNDGINGDRELKAAEKNLDKVYKKKDLSFLIQILLFLFLLASI